MLREVRLLLAALLLILSVLVDSTLYIMSFATDLVFVVLTGLVLWPILKPNQKESSTDDKSN
jgi:Ca2+/Na+ antiporter